MHFVNNCSYLASIILLLIMDFFKGFILFQYNTKYIGLHFDLVVLVAYI